MVSNIQKSLWGSICILMSMFSVAQTGVGLSDELFQSYNNPAEISRYQLNFGAQLSNLEPVFDKHISTYQVIGSAELRFLPVKGFYAGATVIRQQFKVNQGLLSQVSLAYKVKFLSKFTLAVGIQSRFLSQNINLDNVNIFTSLPDESFTDEFFQDISLDPTFGYGFSLQHPRFKLGYLNTNISQSTALFNNPISHGYGEYYWQFKPNIQLIPRLGMFTFVSQTPLTQFQLTAKYKQRIKAGPIVRYQKSEASFGENLSLGFTAGLDPLKNTQIQYAFLGHTNSGFFLPQHQLSIQYKISPKDLNKSQSTITNLDKDKPSNKKKDKKKDKKKSWLPKVFKKKTTQSKKPSKDKNRKSSESKDKKLKKPLLDLFKKETTEAPKEKEEDKNPKNSESQEKKPKKPLLGLFKKDTTKASKEKEEAKTGVVETELSNDISEQKSVVENKYSSDTPSKSFIEISFDKAAYTLQESSQEDLDAIIAQWENAEDPNQLIQITASTDCSGRLETNQILAEKRLENVRAYLVNSGIATDRIDGRTRVEYADYQLIFGSVREKERAEVIQVQLEEQGIKTQISYLEALEVYRVFLEKTTTYDSIDQLAAAYRQQTGIDEIWILSACDGNSSYRQTTVTIE